MSIEEQRVVDGGVAPDENGKGCTEHGIPDIFKNIGKTHKPTNEF